ncbi:MAG: MoaD/ThiS family protein [Thioalkalivibrionaceae bacterium]
MITIEIRYFAALREQFGRSQTQLRIAAGCTPRDVWAALHDEPPAQGVIVAIDQTQSDWDRIIEHDAELAFFPPMTGG